jgi:uncharacterized protein (DUF1697 family)
LPTFIVLLRGVNVGKAKRVAMAEFKAVLEALGCTQVTTLLNSGNAAVKSPKTSAAALAIEVAEALQTRFGFEVPVVVKSAEALDEVGRANSLATVAEDHSRLLVVFAQDSTGLASLQSLGDQVTPPEAFLLTNEAAYLHCPNGILESKAAAALLGKAGKAVTTRNWATVLKLQALAHQLQNTA